MNAPAIVTRVDTPSARPASERVGLREVEQVRTLSILHVITRLDRGGSSDCTLLQAIGAARRGHSVTVASGPSIHPSPLLERVRAQERVALLHIPHLVRRPSPTRDLRALIAIARTLRRGRFDILHVHTSKAGVLGRLAARLTPRRPAVVHQPHGHLFYGYFGPLGATLVTLAERLMAPLADVLLTLSGRGAEEHLCRGIGRPGQFATIRSGIDLKPLRRARARREEIRTHLGFRPQHFVVGSLGRLETIKGAVDLIDGFALAAVGRVGLRLFLGGDGALYDELVDRARSLGIEDRITIARGWTPPERVLPAFDLFILPSHNEAMGRALVEAMACARPVVATAVGGVPEVLEEGRAGLLIPPSDPRAIAMAITRLADDAVLARGLAERGRSRALAFGAGRMNRTLLKLYRELRR
jgi:glycosyltransferase involved in cell wall biosynthesis